MKRVNPEEVKEGNKYFSEVWKEVFTVGKVLFQKEGYCCFMATNPRLGELKMIIETPWFQSFVNT